MESSIVDRGAQSRSSSPLVSETMVTETDLHETVALHHERIDTDDLADIYVVGDVHGCVRELSLLVETLDPGPNDLVLFVGDLVRKGPDSKGVVEFVRRHDNMRSVRGNNEDKLITDRATLERFDADDLTYLESLPVAISIDDALVVHGGVYSTRPLAEQSVQDLLTCRSIPAANGYDGPFWFESYEGPPRVFFGHTVLDEPVVTDWAVGLDTGCVYGGALTAYDYYADEVVQVAAQDTYEERADHKILDPDLADSDADGG